MAWVCRSPNCRFGGARRVCHRAPSTQRRRRPRRESGRRRRFPNQLRPAIEHGDTDFRVRGATSLVTCDSAPAEPPWPSVTVTPLTSGLGGGSACDVTAGAVVDRMAVSSAARSSGRRTVPAASITRTRPPIRTAYERTCSVWVPTFKASKKAISTSRWTSTSTSACARPAHAPPGSYWRPRRRSRRRFPG